VGLVKTAVFPVAGLGTRFLPLTKSTPKEMLPIVTKPLIQYAVEEAIQAGIDHLIFVTSNSKKAIEEYFDKNYELEDRLQKNGNTKALQQVQNIIPRSVSVSYVRQEEPKGLGDAVLKAKRLVGNENFAVLLADDLIASEESSSLLSSMIRQFSECRTVSLALDEVLLSEVHKYGIASFDEESCSVSSLIEKPSALEAPSRWALLGRYIFSPEIFFYLEQLKPGRAGEIQLTDGISLMLKDKPIFAVPFHGKRFDCGSASGFKEAIRYFLD
jgi:UTP--glucose-1-phosphate uridylyltransferase